MSFLISVLVVIILFVVSYAIATVIDNKFNKKGNNKTDELEEYYWKNISENDTDMKITNDELIEMLMHIIDDVYIPTHTADEYEYYECCLGRAKNYIRIKKNELNEPQSKRFIDYLKNIREQLQKCKNDKELIKTLKLMYFDKRGD